MSSLVLMLVQCLGVCLSYWTDLEGTKENFHSMTSQYNIPSQSMSVFPRCAYRWFVRKGSEWLLTLPQPFGLVLHRCATFSPRSSELIGCPQCLGYP